MSSRRKQESARANGAKSKGPVTPEGKEKSSQNATKHGLSASRIVLSCESGEEYQALCDDYFTRFHPHDQAERDQVIVMINSIWRQRRFWNVETGAMNLRVEEREEDLQKNYDEVTDQMRVAKAFSWEMGLLKAIDRHEIRILRQYQRALKTLQELQKNPDPAPQNEPNPNPEHPVTPDPSDPRSSAFISGQFSEKNVPNEPNPNSEHPVSSDPSSSLFIRGENTHPPVEPTPNQSTPSPSISPDILMSQDPPQSAVPSQEVPCPPSPDQP